MTYEEVIALPKEDAQFQSDWLDGYDAGIEDAFGSFHEHCTYGHIVYVDGKSWLSCFAIERSDWMNEKYKCCYEVCPLMK